MLEGQLVGLRARHDDDVPTLHTELYDDVSTRVGADTRAWVPLPVGSSPYAVQPATLDTALFSVVELASGDLAGEALLWGIDTHNRSAHLGISLRPSMRGRGLGADTVQTLCQYGFAVRGLHRLQLETLAENAAMLAAARTCGFVPEGRFQDGAWVSGTFLDVVVMARVHTVS